MIILQFPPQRKQEKLDSGYKFSINGPFGIPLNTLACVLFYIVYCSHLMENSYSVCMHTNITSLDVFLRRTYFPDWLTSMRVTGSAVELRLSELNPSLWEFTDTSPTHLLAFCWARDNRDRLVIWEQTDRQMYSDLSAVFWLRTWPWPVKLVV